jgi:hypothetical protein
LEYDKRKREATKEGRSRLISRSST